MRIKWKKIYVLKAGAMFGIEHTFSEWGEFLFL